MKIFIFIAGCAVVLWIFRSIGNAIQDSKYPHRTCPFCGKKVPGRRGSVAFNGESFVNYNCSCGAYNNYNSMIWYRERRKGKDYDVEMRSSTD